MNVHQHLRPEAGREGKRSGRLDQIETVEPPSEPLVEFDAGERGQAQRGQELLAELLVADKGCPFLVLRERENVDEYRAGIDELHVEGRGVLQRVAISQSIGEQVQGQTRRLLQALERPFVGIGDERERLVLDPHVPGADVGFGQAGPRYLLRGDLPGLDDALAGVSSEEVRAKQGAKTVRGPTRNAPEYPPRSREDMPFRISEGAARPTCLGGDCQNPPGRAGRLPNRRHSVSASCPGGGSSAVASTSVSR